MSRHSGFPLDQALLGFLMQGAAHGYALHERAEQELGHIWYMGMSNVYGTLRELEEAGRVACALDDESYPPRKVYTITADGRSHFLAWLREPVPAMRDMRVEFLAKLYFFHALGLQGVEALLEAQERVCRERLEQLGLGAGSVEETFDRIVNEFRRRRIEANLEWLTVVEREWA